MEEVERRQRRRKYGTIGLAALIGVAGLSMVLNGFGHRGEGTAAEPAPLPDGKAALAKAIEDHSNLKSLDVEASFGTKAPIVRVVTQGTAFRLEFYPTSSDGTEPTSPSTIVTSKDGSEIIQTDLQSGKVTVVDPEADDLALLEIFDPSDATRYCETPETTDAGEFLGHEAIQLTCEGGYGKVQYWLAADSGVVLAFARWDIEGNPSDTVTVTRLDTESTFEASFFSPPEKA